MFPSKAVRRVVLIALSVFFAAVFSHPALAQFKIEFQTCEDLKITKAQYGINVVETATCINSTKSFKPKGTQRNVFVLATFPAVATGAAVTFVVTKNDANGEHVRSMDFYASPKHTTAYVPFTIDAPGKYLVRLVSTLDKTQVWAATDFAVGEDTVGPRATGNTATGQGKVSVCKEIDDDWKCVGASNEWKAGTYFNVLFENPTPVAVDFIGIVLYKHGANGKDVEFINEYQQQIGETNRKYATVGDNFRLQPGVYSVYIISWGKRELMMKNGNLTEYFAKSVLTVK